MEDGDYLSFAGQLSSVIGAETKAPALRSAILSCIAARHSPSFRSYAETFGFSLEGVQLALIVQPVINAEFSGVAFSVDPLTGLPNVIIEAIAGLGENLVSGSATASRFVVPIQAPIEAEAKIPSALLSPDAIRQIAQTARQLQCAFGKPIDMEWALVRDELVILQVRAVTGIEPPPNPAISWSRALTAERYPQPLSPLGWSNLKQVFDQGVRHFADFMNIPLSSKEELATVWNGWVLANADAFNFRDTFRLRLNARETAQLLLRLGHHFFSRKQKLKELKKTLRLAKKRKFGDRLDSLLFFAASSTLLLFLSRTARDTAATWPQVLATFLQEVDEVERLLPTARTPEELLALGSRLQQAMSEYIKPDLVIFAIKEIASHGLAEIADLAGFENPQAVAAGLGNGLANNVSIDFNRKAGELGRCLAQEDWPRQPLSPTTQALADQFIRDFGHLGSSWDISIPTWGEECQTLLQIAFDLHTKVRLDSPDQIRNQIQDLIQDQMQIPNEKMIQTKAKSAPFMPDRELFEPSKNEGDQSSISPPPLLRHPPGQASASLREGLVPSTSSQLRASGNVRQYAYPWHEKPDAPATSTEADFFSRLTPFPDGLQAAKKLVDIMRSFMEIDEEHHFYMGRIMRPTRMIVLNIGEILVRQGCLQQAEQIFWLTDPEVRAALAHGEATNLTPLAILRRRAHQQACREGPSDIDRKASSPSPSPTPEASEKTGMKTLKGLGVSSGSVTGRVIHVENLQDLGKVRDGHILLVRSPNPAYTLVFSRISAIIAETGSLLSHGAVAAREYRLPGVFSVPHAWKILPPDALVSLDGKTGLIHILEEMNGAAE
jgi:phosphohistidine swiveling domain-containing protein